MSFGKDLSKFNDKALDAAKKVLQGAALEVLGSVVKRTPVDTGRLRGNWQTSLNSARSGEVDTGANVALRKIATETSKMRLSDSIYMMNNLPYARTVEYGTFPQGKGKTDKTLNGFSSQAVGGMVRVTIAEWIFTVMRKARDNK